MRKTRCNTTVSDNNALFSFILNAKNSLTTNEIFAILKTNPIIRTFLKLRKLFRKALVIASCVHLVQAEVSLTSSNISYDPRSGIVSASGDVVIVQEMDDGKVRTLHSEKILYNKRTGEIQLLGRSIIKDTNGSIIRTDYIELDKEFKKALIRALEIVLDDGITKVKAKEAQKNGGVYSFEGASYSPCKEINCTMPLWDLQADKVTYDQGKQEFVYKNVKLRIKGIPVFYTPYFSHPSPEVTKKSGILSPTFRTDSDKGIMVGIPLYLAIGDNKDIKVTPYIGNKNRHLASAEYRHRFYYGDFDCSASFLSKSKKKKAAKVDKKTRWHIDTTLSSCNIDNMRFLLKVDRSSDVTYKTRYPVDSLHQSEQYLEQRFNDTKLEADFFDKNYFLGIDSHIYQIADSKLSPKVWPHVSYVYRKDDVLKGTLAFENDTSYITRDQIGSKNLSTSYLRLSNKARWNRSLNLAPFLFEIDSGIRVDYLRTDFTEEDEIDPKTKKKTGKKITYKKVSGKVYPIAENKFSLSLPMIGTIREHPFICGPKVVLSSVEASNRRVKIEQNEDSIFNNFSDLSLFSFNRFGGFDSFENGERIAFGFEGSLYNSKRRFLNFFVGRSQGIGRRHKHQFAGKNASVGRFIIKINDEISFRTRFVGIPCMEKVQLFESGITGENKIFSIGAGFMYDRTINHVQENGISQMGLSAGFKFAKNWQVSASNVFNLKSKNGKKNLTRAVKAQYSDECFDFSVGIFRTNFKDDDIKPRTGLILSVGFKHLGNVSTEGKNYWYKSNIGVVE